MNKIKSLILTTISTLLLSTSIIAQAPQTMSYQAVIRNSNNTLVTSSPIGVRVSILQGSEAGTVVFKETYNPNPQSNANGLINIEIGSGLPATGSFDAINWANGPYFIKVETDPIGGTSYSIVGVSQLLTVPYALHAKTAESVTGGLTENDPNYTSSEAANITADHISKLNNLSGTNTGDQNLSGLATTTSVTAGLATKVDKVTGKDLQSAGTESGQMQYWNGSAWVSVAATENEGATLQMVSGVPTWVGGTEPVNNSVTTLTGRIWMDRNLGATQIATSSSDAASYGDLYQWGRGTDGHEKRTSGTTSTYSSIPTPGHANFIISFSNWLSPANDNLWQGVNGINNPCPSGFRLPTEAEWLAEKATWTSETWGIASPLKLPYAGNRYRNDGVVDAGYGVYWTSTKGLDSRIFFVNNSTASTNDAYRANGYSVRCIKD